MAFASVGYEIPKFSLPTLIFILQFIFISVGYLVSHEIWRFFYPETDTDPKFDKLANFLLKDQNAAGGVGIGIGYVSWNVLF